MSRRLPWGARAPTTVAMLLLVPTASLIAASFAFPQSAAPSPKPILVLAASSAVVHGETLRYEPEAHKNCLGYWTEVMDWAEWTFEVPVAGRFAVEVWQGCGKGQGGSEVAVQVDDQRFDFVVEDTGHFQNFTPRLLGQVELAAGEHTLALQPQSKRAAAVMDVRRVRLVPVPCLRVASPAEGPLHARRVLFLGDSITYGGPWPAFVEAYLRLQYPAAAFDFLNLGLPSETVSGLSEAGHAGGAFPRPDLHERLERALARVQPAVVVACYGMNDGIYAPFAEERFAKFQAGIRRLREAAAAIEASVVHVTPPVFDGTPAANYADVLARYSAWLVAQRAEGWQVVDVHAPMAQYLAVRRTDDRRFRLADDGVHPDAQGHWLIARELLAWAGVSASALVGDSFALATLGELRATEVLDLVSRRQHVLRDAWLREVGHQRPGLPRGKGLPDAEGEAAELLQQLVR